MSNELYFDPASFDFDSLTDVVGMSEGNTKPEPKVNADIHDDMSDLFPRSTGGEEETENDYNEDTSDLERTEQRNGFNFTDAFRSASDDAVIDFEGLTLSKAELKELYKSKTKVESESAFLADQVQRFEQDNKMINQRYLMQATVLENNINLLSQRLNNPNIDNNTYAETAKQLQQQQVAHQQLTNEVNQIMSTRNQQEQLINGYRIRAADQELSNVYPEWNRYKGDVLNYAQEQGISAVTLEKVYDKPLMGALLKAYLYDANKKRVQTEVESKTSNIRNARSTVGAKTSTRTTSLNEQEKVKAAQALNKMGSSRQGNIDALKYIKD